MKNSVLRLSLAATAALVVAGSALAQTAPDLNIDYSTHVESFGETLKTVITTNLGPLFLILAMVVGFGFIWRHVQRLGRSL